MGLRNHPGPVIALAVVATMLLVGCTAPTAPVDDGSLQSDGLGTVDGVAYDDELDVNASTGLTDEELDLVVARTMARVEVLRGLEFERRVPVEVIDRAEFQERRANGGEPNATEAAYENQVWEALLIVDEETDADDAFQTLYGSAVAGYYTTADDGKIVLVSDEERPVVHEDTLVHELIHALQDQHFGLGPRGTVLDEQLARNGLLEGDADYVPQRYEERCASGEWQCLDTPPRTATDRPDDFNEALFLTIYQPYSDGPAFVGDLYDRTDDWSVVNAAYDDRPESATQIIHPDRYHDDGPRNVSVPDRSDDGWERFEDRPNDRPEKERVGEAALVATFYAQGELDRSDLVTDDPRSVYDYDQNVTRGWDGDALVPYRSEDGETGHVFVTAWRSTEDADTFAEAYERTLERMDAEHRDDVHVVPENRSFSGAYRVTVDDDEVTIVHAPDRDALDGIHPVESEDSLDTVTIADPDFRAPAAGLEAPTTIPATTG